MTIDDAGAAAAGASVLSPAEVRAIIAGLMLAILLGALDQTIISVSLPRMATELQGVHLLAWVVSGYLIAMAVAAPIYGKLGDIYGRRAVLSSAIVLFLVASVACALAPTMPTLVAARILQGLGGGGLISVAQATIADVVSPRERGRYQAYISGAFAVASVAGPVLGGVLTQYLSWRWVFWINLPLGLPALLVTRRAMARLRRPTAQRQVDYTGAALLTLGLTALLLAITRAGQGQPLIQAGNLGLLIITMVALTAFVAHALRTPEPIIPLGLFRNRTVTLSCLVIFVTFIELVALTVLIPLELQMLTDAGPDGAALRLIPLSLGVPAGAYMGGRLMAHWGRYKYLQLTGTLIVPAAVLSLSFISPQASVTMGLCLAMIGVGVGVQLPSSTVAVQNAVEHRHVGIATAVSSFGRSLGSAMGVALMMAWLLLRLNTGADDAGLAITGADIIDTLMGRGAQTAVPDPGALAGASEQAFRSVYRLAALIALSSVLFTMALKDDSLDERVPPTAR
ncbi:MAG: MDR family MFS transporter [Castellaniella sp.]